MKRNALDHIKFYLSRMDRLFEWIEKYAAAGALLVFTSAIFCNVAGRYLFHQSIAWAEELSRYLNLIVVFLGISAGIKTDEHIGVDAVQVLIVPKRFHKYMDMVRLVITAIFCMITAYIGGNLSVRLMKLGQKSAAMRLPMWIPYMIVPIGLFMAGIRSLMRLLWIFIRLSEERQEV